MGFQKKKHIRHILEMFLRMIAVICLLVGAVPGVAGLPAQAAVAPTLSITSGTPYFYSIADSNPASVTYGTATATTSVMSASMSGNVVTIKENSASMLYELGYVPIVTSMTVPAETAYQVTLTFTASGKKSANGGSAVAFLEIYDFGSANNSGSLTFNMINNATYSHATYTKLRAKEDTKNKNFGGTYTVTVDFTNTSASDKTIYHYFGFFTGVHFGSKYDHTLTSTCTITAGKIVDRDDIVPTVNASTSNLWHLITTNYVNDTEESSKFVQEKDSITPAEAALMNFNKGDYNYNWSRRAKLTIGTNKLTLTNQADTTYTARMTYVPFSVPITVPAHMTRRYYLTFTIDYERNTGSGAGFFAELIQGGVPESFNTAASATMTGNTKLRVYSTGGDAHSGSVTIPITLTNNTDSAQIHSEDFVFFAGYRQVGTYTPAPTYNLTLTDISYASYESNYDVIVNATNCSYTAPTKVGGTEDCSVTFTPNTGYSLPSTVTVIIGSSTLSASSYTYNSSTGNLTIPAKYIKDAVTVTAAGVPNTYTIVSVDITWGAMEFTYSDGTWNPENHSYESGGWAPDQTGGNQITVTNTGNVAVKVSYGYTRTNTAVTGGFTDEAVPITAPVALPVGDTKDAWLILNGKPTESLNKAVLGTVTVTIGGESA